VSGIDESDAPKLRDAVPGPRAGSTGPADAADDATDGGGPASGDSASGGPTGAGSVGTRLRRWGSAGNRSARRLATELTAWSHRPSGRFALPGLLIVALMASLAVAGGYLVPAGQVADPRPEPAATGADHGGPPATPTRVPSAPAGGGAPTPVSGRPTASAGPPQAALAAWAARLSPVVDIAATALAAYGYTQLALAATQPGCHLSWTTLAGIGKVESNHGRAGGAILLPGGMVTPAIIGPALDGTGGVALVRDTDHGELDNDPVYDHAVGPMQFIPATWRQYAVDADADGVANPNDLNDAALAAGDLLCAGGRDLATAAGWNSAILSYNSVQPYVQSVYAAANAYGVRSRTVT
jgi:hypothetical protein